MIGSYTSDIDLVNGFDYLSYKVLLSKLHVYKYDVGRKAILITLRCILEHNNEFI